VDLILDNQATYALAQTPIRPMRRSQFGYFARVCGLEGIPLPDTPQKTPDFYSPDPFLCSLVFLHVQGKQAIEYFVLRPGTTNFHSITLFCVKIVIPLDPTPCLDFSLRYRLVLIKSPPSFLCFPLSRKSILLKSKILSTKTSNCDASKT